MKNIGIGKVFFHFEATDQEIDEGIPDARIEQAMADIQQVLARHGLSYAPGYTSFWSMAKYSIHECHACQHLMINKDRNPLGLGGNDLAADSEWVVRAGGEFEGKLLCEECLPQSHRWAVGS